MRAWRHWMKQLSQSWKECKEEPAFSCTSTLTKQYKVTYFYINLPVLWLIFFCYRLLPLLLPRVSSALLSSPCCLVAVWFWLLRCRQHWQVKQQGSWAALNAKLLACLKQKGEEEKIKKKLLLSLWRIFGSSSDFLKRRLLQRGEFPPGNAGFAFKKLPLSLWMAPLYS